jgi:hypothetical protein
MEKFDGVAHTSEVVAVAAAMQAVDFKMVDTTLQPKLVSCCADSLLLDYLVCAPQ